MRTAGTVMDFGRGDHRALAPDVCAVGHQGVLAGLDALGQAGCLVDRRWHVLASNSGGLGYFQDTLALRDGRLAGRTPDCDLRLHRLALSVERASSGLAILAHKQGPGLIVRAVRLAVPIGQATTVLTFAKLGITCLPDEAVLREAFGLTATEASVALDVAKGYELRKIASSRGVTIDTIRSHLSNVFAKTGTRRQAALAILLAGLNV